MSWHAKSVIPTAAAGLHSSHILAFITFCDPCTSTTTSNMSVSDSRIMATAAAPAPGLLTQIGMAGSAAVITVTFIHPIDVVVRAFFVNLYGEAAMMAIQLLGLHAQFASFHVNTS